MKYIIQSVEILARPLSSACFQAFLIQEDIPTHTLWLTYQTGKAPSTGDNRRSFYGKLDQILLRELALQPVVREKILELFGDDLVYFDTDHSGFADRLIMVLRHLREEGVQFMLLRGSEVSLDRMVQLQD